MLGEGSGWDLRIRPAPAASGNLGAIFLKKKGACGNVPTSSGLPKSGGHFSEKKAPAATYPQVQGFQKYEGRFSGEKKAPAPT